MKFDLLCTVACALTAADVLHVVARPATDLRPYSPTEVPSTDVPLSKSALSADSSERKERLSSNCFPALGFRMPHALPHSLNGWWCNKKSEYAFMGFSYGVSGCQSQQELRHDFQNIRNRFQGRYVRLYGAYDRQGFYNNVVEAAWDAGIGVHALIWFGYNGGRAWVSRRNELLDILHSNPKAKFVTRVVQFGSEPLFDQVINPYELVKEVNDAKANLASLRIPVTVSDLAFSYQHEWYNGARQVLDNIDVVDAHMLPFFSTQASLARDAWPLVKADLDWFIRNANGKKIYLSENGWPSITSADVQRNNHKAVANVQNEHDYFRLLDERCSEFKSMANGGVGWFAHIYSDDQAAGYGIYNWKGGLKFPFRPRAWC